MGSTSEVERIAVLETRLDNLEEKLDAGLVILQALEKKSNYWSGGVVLITAVGAIAGWFVDTFKSFFIHHP